MKKIISLLLAAVMLAAVLSGCTTLKKLEDGTYDRGAVIEMYISEEVYNFDPQIAVTDENMLKVVSLLFEGLTRIDSNGKWTKALMKDYEVRPNDRDGYSVLITLNKTKWTDARTVQAIDFVNSWKRILDPNNSCEAASLLYDLKNAREIKRSDAGVTVDDLGVSAVDTYTLKITFRNSDVDLDRFFRNCASIALVPLREDILARYGDKWAMKTTSICTNGPFALREAETGGVVRLERSGYYYRDPDKDKYYDKYVTPYKLITDYGKGNAEAQAEAYENGELFYLGNIALSKRADFKNKATVVDMPVTQSYYFNTNNSIFSKPEVRRALSLAIDREHIVEILTFAKAATGYVPYGAVNDKANSSFRSAGEDLISTGANVEEAKSLLSKAGVRGGSFSITVRKNSEADLAVAQYVAEVWGSLGFTVRLDPVGTSVYSVTEGETTTLYAIDDFQEKYKTGDFDVIAVDDAMPSVDAFSTLSQFSKEFSGNGVDMESGNYEIHGHVTGFSNDAYDELIEKAYEEPNASERAKLLHEAEKMLLEEMPVCPLVFMQNAYVANGVLSGFRTDRYGLVDFRKVKMKDYMKYKPAEDEE
ncbi:MAG: peptide ABC transporter substrate-binding protein [Clostridia bacterium]|nr:peptide ABC transporter substrate-binding protein [Clostridia bacterium]